MELVVCYRSIVDGAWIPFMHYKRSELREARNTGRDMAYMRALSDEWCLKRGRKIIARFYVRY